MTMRVRYAGLSFIVILSQAIGLQAAISETVTSSFFVPPTEGRSIALGPIDEAGVARVCVSIEGGSFDRIDLPATTVFEDEGATPGAKDDPSTWTYDPSMQHAAIVTLEAAVLRKAAPCAEVKVKMLIAPLWEKRSEKASDNHVFTIDDVLDYPIPQTKPPVEIGKLIEDISVKAVLLTDVAAAIDGGGDTESDAARAARCLEGARSLAAYLGGGVGTPTSMMVPLGGLAAQAVSLGCPIAPGRGPNFAVSWDGLASPPTDTLKLIAHGGAYLIGASDAEVQEETSGCIANALKPDADEMASREFRGAKIECQAFSRDGGGGLVTVYRRFGAYPVHNSPDRAAIEKMNIASKAVKDDEVRRAAAAFQFAEWWKDPAIPESVKTFAMLSARVLALEQRCPTSKAHRDKVASWAVDAKINPSDIEPGGKYYALMSNMMSAMRLGTAKEGVAEACVEAKRYD